MTIELAFKLLLFAVVAYVLGNLAFRAFRHGSFSAAFFDAPVERTLGEVEDARSKLGRSVLRVHRLGAGSTDSIVAIELVHKSFASYEMNFINLSEPSVRSLIAHLQEAISHR